MGQTDAIAGCREDRIHVGTGPFCRLHDLVPTFYMTYSKLSLYEERAVLVARGRKGTVGGDRGAPSEAAAGENPV